MFMVNKPDVRCDLEADEANGIPIHKDRDHYYKKLEGTSRAFVWCKKSKFPYIRECHDPKMPDMDLDAVGFKKCFKPGHNQRVSTKFFDFIRKFVLHYILVIILESGSPSPRRRAQLEPGGRQCKVRETSNLGFKWSGNLLRSDWKTSMSEI